MRAFFTIWFAISFACSLIKQVMSGQIYGTEIQVKYPIATQATEYTFNILFETILTSANYLRIKWPYQLDYLNGKSDVSITIQDLQAVNLPITTNTLTISDNTYHFQFSSNILPYTWYKVKLVGVINEENPQSLGFQNMISIATVTSTVSNAVILDYNPLFGNFALSSAPPSTATLEPSIEPLQDSVKNSPGQSYLINLKLVTKKSVSSYDDQNPSGVQYQVQMTDVSFQFLNPNLCTIVNRPAGECTCSYLGGKTYILLVSCTQDLIVENTSTQPIQVKVTVVNSMRNVQNTEGFYLKVIYPPTQLIVETGQITNFFQVNSISLKNMQLKLMHGIPYSSTFLASYEMPLGIYIPTTINPRFQPFNSVRVYFQVETAINNANGGLLVEAHYNSAEAILESSVYHNLPLFDANKPIRCKFDYQLKVIQCKGVGELLVSTDYYIGARIALTNNPTLTTDANGNQYIQNFGGIQVKSILQDSLGNVFYGEVTQKTYAVNQIDVYKNKEFTDILPGGTHTIKNFGDHMVCTGSSANPFTTEFQKNYQDGANVGIFPSTSNTRLIFYIGVSQVQQTYQDFLGFKQQSFMKLLYNDNIIQIDAADLPKGIEFKTPVLPSANAYSDYNSGSSDNQIVQQKDLTNQNLFKYAYFKISSQKPLFNTANQGFGLQNVKYPSTFTASQFVADDRVLDFLLTFMYKDDSNGSSSTNKLLPHSSMLFQGYTTRTTYESLESGFSNIYTKGSDINKGLKIPTLLRIYGSITSAAAGQKLALIPDRSVLKFFAVNQFDLIPGSSPSEGCGGTTQACYSYEDGGSSKVTSPPDNWSLNPFIVFDLADPTILLHQVVAVALRPKILPKTLNVALIQISASGLIEVINSYRIYGASLGLTPIATKKSYFDDVNTITANANNWDQTSNYSENVAQVASQYKMSNLALIKPSQTAASFLFLADHTDSGNLVSVNVSLLYFGSGFTISSIKQDLIGNSQITAFPGSTAVSKCIQKFKYKSTLINVPYYNYVTFCPYDQATYTDGAAGQGVTFNSFAFPSQWGINYPLSNTFAYSWSANSGKLIEIKQQAQSVPATGFATSCVVTQWSPQYYLETDRQQISMTITPSVKATLVKITDFYTVIITFSSFPTDMIFLPQCQVETVNNPSSNLYPAYTTCLTKIKAANILTFTIVKNSDDSSPISFDPLKDFKLTFLISYPKNTAAARTFTVQLSFNSYIQDYCNSGGATNLAEGQAPAGGSTASITIANLICSTPTSSANSMCEWEFNYSGRDSIPSTTIRFNLGFMSTPKMLQNLDCQVLESMSYKDYFPEGVDNGTIVGYTPSDKFSQISYNSGLNTIDIVFRALYTAPVLPFKMRCYGFKAPNGDNTQELSVQWIDTNNQNTLIQSSFPNINYFSFPFFKAKTMTSTQLKLVSKLFTAPGFEAVYTIQFIPQNVRINQKSRIYLEFSVGYKQNLNSKSNSPQCQLNGMEVTCLLDTNNARRLIIYPLHDKQTTLEPLKTYTLVVAGIQQPQSQDSYGYIWFGIDADDNLQNGLQEQGDIKDTQVQQTKITYLQQSSYSFSTLKVRQQRVMMSFNFTCSSRTITSNRIAFIRLHPSFFNSQLDKLETDIQCTFYRNGDPLRKNITTSCERIYGNSYIRMNLTVDEYNTLNQASYWIQIFYLPSPDYENSSNFPIFLNFFITDLTMNTILYSMSPSLTQTPVPISFQNAADTSKQIMWYDFNQNPSIQQKQNMYNQYSGRDRQVQLTIYRGIITDTIIFLSFENQNTYFDLDYTFYFVNATEFAMFDVYMGRQQLTQSSIKINTGDDGVKIAMAAKVTTALGTYTLELKKYGLFKPFEDPEISPLPNLVVNVQEKVCILSLSSTTLTINVGTYAGPIIIDFQDCIPSQKLIISGEITSGTTTDIGFDSQPQQIISYVHNSKAIYYFGASDSLTAPYNTYQVTFTLSGVNAQQYTFVNNQLDINIAAAPTKITPVISSFTKTLKADQSEILLNGKCNQDGYLFWAVALNEQYLNDALFTLGIEAEEIMQKIQYQEPSNTVSLLNVLIDMRYRAFNWVGTSLRFSDQLLARQFGVQKVTKDVLFSLTLTDLPQRSIYSFISFCGSSFGEISKAQTESWTTSWRLDGSGNPIFKYDHLQIDLTFNSKLSENQLNNVLCQLQQALELNVYSLATPSCTICNQSKNYTISNAANYQDLNFSPTTCPQKTKAANAVVYSFYAWSGEQSSNIIVDMAQSIQAMIVAVPCFFVNVLNYSYDLDIVSQFTNIFTLTPITPQPIASIQPKLDFMGFVNTNNNITLQFTNKNAAGFLIVGVHKFKSVNDTNVETTESGIILSSIASQPTPLKLRQGYFGDDTKINHYHGVFKLTAGQAYNVTLDVVINDEYAFYWTLASQESCADSFYSPVGFKQFIFKGLEENFSHILKSLHIILLLLIALI